MAELASLCVAPTDSIKSAIACIEFNRTGIALVTDSGRRLLGTVTDGDVRRAILAGIKLTAPVSAIITRKKRGRGGYVTPVTAPVGLSRPALLKFMKDKKVFQLPFVDEAGRVVDLVTLEELAPRGAATLRAVIVAGGYGTRLRPLTDDLPKPMLPVGDRPLMQHTVERLRDAGIKKVSVTTHYRSHKISDYFGDGQRFGVELDYVVEEQPLGTAGSLSMLCATNEPMLVINGDIVTDIDYRAMVSYHQEHQAEMTVGVRPWELKVPYGVLECHHARVRSVREKPEIRFLVNAGIYLLEPTVHRYIPNAKRFDMTDLIQALLDDKRPVVGFPVHEYWADVGHPDVYEQLRMGMSKEQGWS